MRFSVALLLACVPASLAAQTLLVANQRVATVTLIDTATNHVTATIAENTSPSWGHELDTTPDGKTAYVPIYGSAGLGYDVDGGCVTLRVWQDDCFYVISLHCSNFVLAEGVLGYAIVS